MPQLLVCNARRARCEPTTFTRRSFCSGCAQAAAVDKSIRFTVVVWFILSPAPRSKSFAQIRTSGPFLTRVSATLCAAPLWLPRADHYRKSVWAATSTVTPAAAGTCLLRRRQMGNAGRTVARRRHAGRGAPAGAPAHPIPAWRACVRPCAPYERVASGCRILSYSE